MEAWIAIENSQRVFGGIWFSENTDWRLDAHVGRRRVYVDSDVEGC